MPSDNKKRCSNRSQQNLFLPSVAISSIGTEKEKLQEFKIWKVFSFETN